MCLLYKGMIYFIDGANIDKFIVKILEQNYVQSLRKNKMSNSFIILICLHNVSKYF